MKGYKAFNNDLTCRGFKFEVGKTYEINESPVGFGDYFSFCKNLHDVYKSWDMSDYTRICEVEATGEIFTDNDVDYCTNKIMIVKEIAEKTIKHCNIDNSNVGFLNSGNKNSGNWNSGNWNSGNSNSGGLNSGDSNSGDRNSGSWNSGNWNFGNWNSGNSNYGFWNSGNWNYGDWNSGDWNSGNSNSGDWNSGNSNSGVFNTEMNPRIMMFDKKSNWTFRDWLSSRARYVLSSCPYTYSDFIDKSDMSDKEKERHPEHKTIGGYVKVFIATSEDKQKWWDGLSKEDKNACYDLPNFDKEKFEKCVGIKIKDMESEE